jgi:hypothetical protein
MSRHNLFINDNGGLEFIRILCHTFIYDTIYVCLSCWTRNYDKFLACLSLCGIKFCPLHEMLTQGLQVTWH